MQQGGPAAASADTVLCESIILSGTCPSNEVLPSGTWITYGDSPIYPEENFFEMDSTFIDLRCGTGVVGGQSTAEVGEPSALPMTTVLSLYDCQVNKGPFCISTEVSKPAGKLAASTPDAWFAIGSTSDPLVVSYECKTKSGELVDCTMSATYSMNLDVTYNEETLGSYQAKTAGGGLEMVKTAGNALCPETATARLSAYGSESDGYPAEY